MKNILLLIFTLFAIGAQGQYSSYNLNDYARPDLRREALVLGLTGFASQLDQFDQAFESNYNFRTSGNYTGYFNSKTEQRDIFSNAQLGYSKDLHFNGSFSYDDTRRKYHKENSKQYLLLGYGGYGNFTTRTELDRLSNITPNIKIGYGYGRLEIINDAWHAATILEELNERGIGQIIDHEKLTELAYKIGTIKNIRRLDFRHEFISELEMLSQAMIDVGFVDELDITTFAHLQDIYRYESFVTRLSGSRIEGFLNTSYNMIGLLGDSNSSYSNNLAIRLNANYNNSKAISMDWQREYGAGIDFIRNIGEKDFHSTNLRPYLSYGLGWYPNYRTNFNVNASTYYNMDRFDQWYDYNSFGLALSAEFNYYLSPELRFYASGNFNFTNVDRINSNYNSNNLQNEVRFGVNYYLR